MQIYEQTIVLVCLESPNVFNRHDLYYTALLVVAPEPCLSHDWYSRWWACLTLASTWEAATSGTLISRCDPVCACHEHASGEVAKLSSEVVRPCLLQEDQCSR